MCRQDLLQLFKKMFPHYYKHSLSSLSHKHRPAVVNLRWSTKNVKKNCENILQPFHQNLAIAQVEQFSSHSLCSSTDVKV